MTLSGELLSAYQQAEYCVPLAHRELVICIGRVGQGLNELLAAHDVASAAFITAANPGSQRLTAAQNSIRHRALLADVRATSLTYIEGEGRDPQGAWPAETSLLVLGLNQSEATRLASAYQQNAFVYLQWQLAPQLIVIPPQD